MPPAKLAKEAMHIVNYLGSALAPKEKKLVNDKEFQQECGWSGEERTCILALKGPLYSELQQNSLGNLVKSFYKNKVPIVSVEAKLRWLSFESSGVMKSKFSMRLYAIRNGKRFLSLGAPSTEERMHQFVQDAIDVSEKILRLFRRTYVSRLLCLNYCRLRCPTTMSLAASN